MENFLDLDHMSVDRSPTIAASDLNLEREETMSYKGSRPVPSFPSRNTNSRSVENGTVSRSSSPGNEIPSLNSDSAADVLKPSKTEATVDFVQLFKEGYYNKPEFHNLHKSTDVVTDEMNNGDINTHEMEKHAEEGWIGGMFDFSEEGTYSKQANIQELILCKTVSLYNWFATHTNTFQENS